MAGGPKPLMAGGPEPLRAELLFARPPELDAEALAARVRETHPRTVADPADGGGALLAHEDFPFEEGTKAILTSVMRPGADAEGAGPLRPLAELGVRGQGGRRAEGVDHAAHRRAGRARGAREGPGGEGRWTLQLEDALVAPARAVLDIDRAPSRAAGGRG